MGEKRKSKRTAVEMAASFGVDGSSLNENSSVKNVSQGGFCFQSEKLIEPGTNIKLAVELSDGDSITIKVQSVWYKKNEKKCNYMIGVQIVDTDDRDIEKFLRFYEQQSDE